MTGTWIEIICYLITLTRDDEVRGGGGLKVAVPAQEAEIVNGSEGRARVPMDHPVSQEPSSIHQAWVYLVTRSGAIPSSCVSSGTREARAQGMLSPSCT